MFNIARVSRAAPRVVAAPRRSLGPVARRFLSSQTATTESAPTTNTSQPFKGPNAPKVAPTRPHPKPNSAPAARSSSSPSSSSTNTATATSTGAADPVTISARAPTSKQGSNGLPFYTPKTIGFSQEDAVAAPTHSSADADIDWENSYHGIATRPVTSAQFRVLMEPIAEEDIEVKPDGVIYLPEIKYRRRLNEAFGPMGWGLIPRSEPTLANGVATREYALVIGGRFVAQAQGENTYFSAEGMPSAVEGCKSNALMRCCKDLGIASELWDPVFIRAYKSRYMKEVWVEHATTKKKRQLWFKTGQVNVAYPYKKV